MAYKEVFRVEISEVIRRWQAGESRRHIASGTGLSKDTVRKQGGIPYCRPSPSWVMNDPRKKYVEQTKRN